MNLCGCGCGKTTKRRFAPGHWMKTPEGRVFNSEVHFKEADTEHGDGYLTNRRGFMEGHALQHRMVAEKALGRPLPHGVEVHHWNENKADNRGVNLVICQNKAYHRLLHQRMAAFDACGHAHWRKCWLCKKYSPPEDLYFPPSGSNTGRHKACMTEAFKTRGWK